MQIDGLTQSVLERPISDHFPICLTPDSIKWGPMPFRFDNKWLKVDGCRRLVLEIWQNNKTKGTASFKFAAKLTDVKNAIKKWSKEEEERINEDINNCFKGIEEIDRLEGNGTIDEPERNKREPMRKKVAFKLNMEAISWR